MSEDEKFDASICHQPMNAFVKVGTEGKIAKNSFPKKIERDGIYPLAHGGSLNLSNSFTPTALLCLIVQKKKIEIHITVEYFI